MPMRGPMRGANTFASRRRPLGQKGLQVAGSRKKEKLKRILGEEA
jgi:hypothetical protein